ncbi:Holliday junction DNA helicase RuvA [Candidatus Endobugula sertula]|uniref:Holliday junction branch migration complex subunit RuvA n=1 Tax=Candidatus Endobugula sertula TaxID=62101 RepID=A0A1D2QM01_9GAMM|nr:Holliday junction DNA helicase RuvA [Candidatus Endobugula sertula]
MIGRLSGVLLEKQAPYLLVDVNGVAYEVQAPMTSFYPLPELGGSVVLHTHLSISENAHQLFGFYSIEERVLFRTLIKVNGVGPKMALAILSGMPADEFVQCVRTDNIAALVKLPGVGKKTAERLVIEVKDRLKDWHSHANTILTLEPRQTTSSSSVIADAESALIALGYKPAQAAQMITAVGSLPDELDSEALIRLALQGTAG